MACHSAGASCYADPRSAETGNRAAGKSACGGPYRDLFCGLSLIQMLIRLLPGTGAAEDVLMLTLNAGVLAILILDGIQRQKLLEGVESMKSGREESGIPTEHLFWNNRRMAEAVNGLGEDLKSAVQEQMKSERMKADLITNVSHDLKTPLTSIINYVDLMKREPSRIPGQKSTWRCWIRNPRG